MIVISGLVECNILNILGPDYNNLFVREEDDNKSALLAHNQRPRNISK